MVLILAEPLIYQVSASNQMHGKWLLFAEFSFFSKSSLRKTVFTVFEIGFLAFRIQDF